MLASFDQASVLQSAQTYSRSATYGCCLALSLEWVRLAIYKYQTAGRPDAQLRADLLTSQIATVAASQDLCNEFNRQYRKQEPGQTARYSHQVRHCYIANYVGRQPGVADAVQDVYEDLRAAPDSFDLAKLKDAGDWPAFAQNLMAANAYSLLLIKGAKDGQKWHHAVALWAYRENGQEMAQLFDANHGEVRLAGSELGEAINEIVARCESGASPVSMRYIRLEQGFGPTNGIGT